MNKVLMDTILPELTIEVDKSMVRVGPMRSGTGLEMERFIGVFKEDRGDKLLVTVQSYAAPLDFTRCVFIRASQLTREKLAGPKGRLP